MVYVAMLFWHCRNFLTSWSYLYATVAIWLSSYIARLFFLNWTNPRRFSWLVGDDASVTLLPENAIKITIPTQVKWRPGQYVYLRMPGISVLESHPFTIASLCSDDLPSEYGDQYKDMVLVFRPFGGFTRRVLENAHEKGPWHTYRAFVDGPYGGMKRKLESFDEVILIAGGSGITAIVSQLLDLIKRMRDGKAITKSIRVIWALKRPETLEWFKEELRICRECAPPDSVKCQFFITSAKRQNPRTMRMTAQTTQQHIGTYFRDHINDAFNGIAEKRASYMSKRNSAYIRDEAEGDPDREKQLRDENEDVIAALPQAHLVPANQLPSAASSIRNFSHPMDDEDPDSPESNDPYEHFNPSSFRTPAGSAQPPNPYSASGPSQHNIDRRRDLAADIKVALAAGPSSHLLDPNGGGSPHSGRSGEGGAFDFGFPSTPTEFQKNLMRFAFLPATTRASDGWTTEYGRPDLPFMLKDMADGFSARTAIFVCGPPGMRVAVSKTVADLQRYVLGASNGVEEIFLHTENYAL
jgi:NAD(P)H-flavin reductase